MARCHRLNKHRGNAGRQAGICKQGLVGGRCWENHEGTRRILHRRMRQSLRSHSLSPSLPTWPGPPGNLKMATTSKVMRTHAALLIARPMTTLVPSLPLGLNLTGVRRWAPRARS